MTSFVPGQRWLSDTEAEQGLGTVLSSDHRNVILLFPSTGETRYYSLKACPLTRVLFGPNERIESHKGWSMIVESVSEQAGLVTYHGSRDDGEKCILPETELGNCVQLDQPRERLFSGQLDPINHFTLRYKTLEHASRLRRSPVYGLTGTRTELLPHQLHISREVATRHAPRVMLADEVGLGKTIEAGMIMHQQLLTGRSRRILVLVPESLQHQWLVELHRRFYLKFSLFDEERCQAEGADNPFDGEQLVLSSLSLFTTGSHRLQQLVDCKWDLLVIDEAHHLSRGNENGCTAYQIAETIASSSAGLLLLTATPEQTGQQNHFAHLQLLDRNRFHDFNLYKQEREQYQPIAKAAEILLDQQADWQKSSGQNAIEVLHSHLGEAFQSQINALGNAADDTATIREALLQALIDRHGTGRVLFRNTRAGIGGFAGRVVQAYPQPLPELYQIALENEENAERSLTPELAYQTHIKVNDMDPWWKVDPRIEWLITLTKLIRQEKILVICAHAETALDLRDALRVLSGITVAVFHEGMTLVERDRQAAWFAEEDYGAQLMATSEIGSEGRNFQFAHHLVLFDLPSHPDLLEQRIGRLDRIGQTETIKIHVPYLEQTAQSLLFHWYNDGLNAFASTAPSANQVFSELGDQLQALLSLGRKTNLADLQPLISQTKERSRIVSERLKRGRDRLLEIHSQGGSSGHSLIAAIEELSAPKQLKRYTERLFEYLGVDSEDHSKHSLVVRPGAEMLTHLPWLPDDGMTVTFDRTIALRREDMHFLSWEHPLIQQSMKDILDSTVGNAAVAMIKNPAVKPGTMLLELLYQLVPVGDKQLQLDRYLQTDPIRLLIEPGGNNLADKVAFDTLNARIHPVKKSTAKQWVKSRKDDIVRMLASADKELESQVQPIIDEACDNLQQSLHCEISRLEALRKVNPNISDSEIERLKEQATAGYKSLRKATVRMDALRLLVAG